ncbi:hypothetical protein PG993_006280 [Apiospora rasikravindrae]|uniref:Uncharacterized protein n=1 Tax=Apiospora rasikravindrae TaxID=990691 RepID=A0ABR1T593_9PEZI
MTRPRLAGRVLRGGLTLTPSTQGHHHLHRRLFPRPKEVHQDPAPRVVPPGRPKGFENAKPALFRGRGYTGAYVSDVRRGLQG